MRTIRFDVEYDGTDFRGFAPQPGARTVGGELEGVLQRILGERIRVNPAGRTDSGVHARGQVVSFQTNSALPCADMKRAVNALTGDDLLVRVLQDAPEGFDARRSAQTRCYEYAVWNSSEPDIWSRRWMAHVDQPLDVRVMNSACQLLVGRHDFAAFRTHRTQDDPSRGTVRRVHGVSWSRDAACGSVVRLVIEADAFLRHMVRTIAGTSLLIGLGKLPEDEMATALASGERAAA